MKCNWRLWYDSRQGETYLVGVNISLLLEMWRRVMMLAKLGILGHIGVGFTSGGTTIPLDLIETEQELKGSLK